MTEKSKKTLEMIKAQIKDYLEHLKLFSRNARWFLLGSFFMGLGFSVFGLLLNLYFKQLGFQEATIGSILSAASLGTVLVAIPAAILVDHMQLKRVLMVAAGINAASLVTMTLSSVIMPIRVLYGISGAMFTVHSVAASPFFMRNSTPKERPYLFGVNFGIETISGFFGSLVGGFVPTQLVAHGLALIQAYRLTLIGGVLLAAVAALVFYGIMKMEKPKNGGRFRLTEYLGARDWRTLLRLTIPHFLIGMGAGLVIPFLNLYFLKRFELGSDMIGRIFSMGAVFTAVGFLIGPALAKRIGLIRTAVATQFASIPFFLILAFSNNLSLSIMAFLFRGSLMNMAWPMYNNFAMEMVPEEQQAGTNSIMMLAWNASWMVSANVGGYIIQRYGFTMVMLITVGLYIASTTSAWLLFRHQSEFGKAMPLTPSPADELRAVLSSED